MLSELYLKTKEQISNIHSLEFSNEEWDWFLDSAVKKRLSDLEKPESYLIQSNMHIIRAKALLKNLPKCI